MKIRTLMLTAMLAVVMVACANVGGKAPLPDEYARLTPKKRLEHREQVYRASEAGHMNAMTFLAYDFFYGHTGPIDYKEGGYWMERAAVSGSPTANSALAHAYATGNFGLPKDLKKARDYATRSYELFVAMNPNVEFYQEFRNRAAIAVNTRGIISINENKKEEAIKDFCLAMSIDPNTTAAKNLAISGGKCSQ